MAKVWFDTQRLTQRLRDAGWSPNYADAITDVFHDALLVDPSTIKWDTLRLAGAFQMLGATWEQAADSARAVADAYAGRVPGGCLSAEVGDVRLRQRAIWMLSGARIASAKRFASAPRVAVAASESVERPVGSCPRSRARQLPASGGATY
jgi:hypothetical protein